MALLRLSGRALLGLNYLFWAVLFVGVTLRISGWAGATPWLVGAVLLLFVRIGHGLLYPMSILPLRGEDLIRARAESGREWLPILDEQRDRLASYQALLVDEVAGLLSRKASPRVSPGACSWWKAGRELCVEIVITDREPFGLKSAYRSPNAAFISYGTVDTSDKYDFEFEEDIGEVVFHADDSQGAIAEVVARLRDALGAEGDAP